MTGKRHSFLRRLLSGWLIGLIIVFAAACGFFSLAADVWLKKELAWDVALMRATFIATVPPGWML